MFHVMQVIQLVLWIVDSRRSKHMTGNLQLLRNFVEKFIRTIRFGNDHFAAITRYGDYIQGNLTICHGVDLLTGSRESNLYTFFIYELAASSPVCLMSKATSTKSWLWHRRLSHLNFGTINQLTSKDLVDGLLKFKYDKDHLCSACEQAMASECNNSGPGLNCSKFKDSSDDMNEIPSQQDLDNLFGPLNEEYYVSSTSEVTNNSTANTLDVEDTPSPSSIIVEDSDAPQVVTSLVRRS
ncbi:integrase, catalytic region, zinc finger, CCHC-type containing protein [Tanacetum coccineum]